MLQMFSYYTFCYCFCCKCNTFLEKNKNMMKIFFKIFNFRALLPYFVLRVKYQCNIKQTL